VATFAAGTTNGKASGLKAGRPSMAVNPPKAGSSPKAGIERAGVGSALACATGAATASAAMTPVAQTARLLSRPMRLLIGIHFLLGRAQASIARAMSKITASRACHSGLAGGRDR
jgi:hypothetical protein